jgi:uncharacterized coiled-coil protein SlyX
MPTNIFNFGPVLDSVLANVKTLQVVCDGIRTRLVQLESKMAEDFTHLNQASADLKAEVALVADNMKKLFDDLAAARGSGNQAAVDALTVEVNASIDALKAAVTANPAP